MSRITVTHVNGPPTHIPDTPAGDRCRDVIFSIAQKMLDDANKATGELIQSNFPGAKTTGKSYADLKHKRTIEWNGEHITLIYDYMTKTASVAQ